MRLNVYFKGAPEASLFVSCFAANTSTHTHTYPTSSQQYDFVRAQIERTGHVADLFQLLNPLLTAAQARREATRTNPLGIKGA